MFIRHSSAESTILEDADPKPLQIEQDNELEDINEEPAVVEPAMNETISPQLDSSAQGLATSLPVKVEPKVTITRPVAEKITINRQPAIISEPTKVSINRTPIIPPTSTQDFISFGSPAPKVEDIKNEDQASTNASPSASPSNPPAEDKKAIIQRKIDALRKKNSDGKPERGAKLFRRGGK